MKGKQAPLILPVENRLRELDPKLLLACFAAERGFRVVIGARAAVDFRVARYPRSIYLCKSFTSRAVRMLDIIRDLGHDPIAWDEEVIVHYELEHYYARRLSADALSRTSLVLAWGDDNAELVRKFPGYTGTPIEVTGNPRIDLLRPELRPLFQEEAREWRRRYGDFALVNTNFAGVNAYFERMNLVREELDASGQPTVGTGGERYARDFAFGLSAHKRALFEHFLALLPELADAFPDRNIVVRPHPSERLDPWLAVASGRPNLHVVRQGNVVPWLLAARVLVHNGCTTAVEAAALGQPVLSYRPICDERFDLHLPNSLGTRCSAAAEVIRGLASVFAGQRGAAADPAREEILGRFLAARSGPLACERIVDVLEERARRLAAQSPPLLRRRLRGRANSIVRSIDKRYIKARRPQHRNNPGYQLHRFAAATAGELQQRVGDFGRTLGRFGGIAVRERFDQVFEVQG